MGPRPTAVRTRLPAGASSRGAEVIGHLLGSDLLAWPVSDSGGQIMHSCGLLLSAGPRAPETPPPSDEVSVH